MTVPVKSNLYSRAGIEDPAEFYRTKFVSDEVLDARYFSPLNRFHMRMARTMWVYDNVRPNSSALDLGCGAGTLALLKRKGVTLTGVDLSLECAAAARRNGYDQTFSAQLTSLPFASSSFDYVISLDVLGHITFEQKDAVLAEIKRVLRPGGVTMHGIECTDPVVQRGYDEMSPEELESFVAVDGHVGLEREEQHASRFRRLFHYVQYEPRYALCLSSDEFIKQSDKYRLRFERDFVDYLRGLSFKERQAFDMAMGYVFNKVSELEIKLPSSGLYCLLKASEAPLGPFYNEHRDRRDLFQPNAYRHTEDDVPADPRSTSSAGSSRAAFCLDRGAVFDEGWYEPDLLPPIARWMGSRAAVTFSGRFSRLRLDLTTHMPNLKAHPQLLEFKIDGVPASALCLLKNGWIEVWLEPGEILPGQLHRLEIEAGRTWQPRPHDTGNRDDRELSIAVCNIEVYP